MIEYRLTPEFKNLEASQLISRHTVVCHAAQEKGVCANEVGILTKKSCNSHSSVAL